MDSSVNTCDKLEVEASPMLSSLMPTVDSRKETIRSPHILELNNINVNIPSKLQPNGTYIWPAPSPHHLTPDGSLNDLVNNGCFGSFLSCGPVGPLEPLV